MPCATQVLNRRAARTDPRGMRPPLDADGSRMWKRRGVAAGIPNREVVDRSHQLEGWSVYSAHSGRPRPIRRLEHRVYFWPVPVAWAPNAQWALWRMLGRAAEPRSTRTVRLCLAAHLSCAFWGNVTGDNELWLVAR